MDKNQKHLLIVCKQRSYYPQEQRKENILERIDLLSSGKHSLVFW